MKLTAYVYWKKISDDKHLSAQETSAVGREVLKQALLEVFQLNLEEEIIDKGRFGKPYLANHPEVHYNISHSGCYVVCAVSGSPVGIDIQKKRVIAYDKLGKKVFSDEEYCKFLRLEKKQDSFFRQWVRIESYLKWTGEGITRDLKGLKMDGWHQFLHVNKNYVCAIWAQTPLSIFMRKV